MSFTRSYLLAMICAFGLLLTSTGVQAQGFPQTALEGGDVATGEGLFSNNCAQCHAVHEQVVGPALKDVWKRWNSLEELTNFIRYPQKVIDGGENAYATGLYKKYKQYMPNHDFLTADDVKGILAYVATVPVPPIDGGGGGEGTSIVAEPKGVDSGLLTAIITGLTVILIGVLVAMAALIAVLARNLRERKDLTEEEKDTLEQAFSFKKFVTHPTFIGIVAFVFVSVVGQKTIDGLFAVGVQQGYAPEQPIPFSHKLHAGYYEIDCKYCHTGVEKGKSANIPSANICMNCHNSIRQESPNMQKIYEHIENDEPIQWVRVHNLPDLAYFNHSQHVKVAGLDCENCHGEIKEMEVVQQHSLLTMGWCIDCHRQTEVNGDNEYYDRMVKIHESKNTKEPLKAEDIGGLECSKCHY